MGSSAVALGAGSALAIGFGIAAISGAIGGAVVDVATQIANTGKVSDVKSIGISALQWAVINTVNVLFCAGIEGISFLDVGIGFSMTANVVNSTIMNFLTGAVGLIVDIERSKYTK